MNIGLSARRPCAAGGGDSNPMRERPHNDGKALITTVAGSLIPPIVAPILIDFSNRLIEIRHPRRPITQDPALVSFVTV
jgi:hypothetical protein